MSIATIRLAAFVLFATLHTGCSRYTKAIYNAPFRQITRPVMAAVKHGSFLHTTVNGRRLNPKFKEVITVDSSGKNVWFVYARVINIYTIRIKQRSPNKTVVGVRGKFFLPTFGRLRASEKELLHELDSFIRRANHFPAKP